MDQKSRGLSQEQQNDCRAELNEFMNRHELSDWEMMVRVEETTAGKFSIRIEITPPSESGLPGSLTQEIEVADASINVAGEVGKMLELAFHSCVAEGRLL
jgi:hypothetical protein